MGDGLSQKRYLGLDQKDYPQLVRDIKEVFEKSNIILFSGDLGSGKTTLIKEICRFFKVEDSVSSPTFSIINEYLGDGERVIYHFDLYRIKGLEELMNIGVTEYLDSGELCLIEWPEKVKPLLEFPYFEFRFHPSENNESRDLDLIAYE